MTKPKFRCCPACQVENQAIRKFCITCYASLSKSKKIEALKDRLDNEWGQGVWKNRNAARVVSSAQVADPRCLSPSPNLTSISNSISPQQSPSPQSLRSTISRRYSSRSRPSPSPSPSKFSHRLPNQTPTKEKRSPSPQSLRSTISRRYSSRSRPSHSPSKVSHGLPNQTPTKEKRTPFPSIPLVPHLRSLTNHMGLQAITIVNTRQHTPT
ncbi:hypothetical protein DPX16_23554 [Anabarilius grahami]|uniref:Uncharacterized protein n=1 Tax=Anabarilius grahami TaxID=495550 RepID=A0A3N0Y7G3_ANAGA|nr:hypothetical protein DPX16_23554 [Anabarilius grahami]